MVSQMLVKVVVSLSSIVNMSEMLTLPAICQMETVFSYTDSRTALLQMVMWRKPLVVVDLDQNTHAVLSL